MPVRTILIQDGPMVPGAVARASAFELQVPIPLVRSRISAYELWVPLANVRSRISAYELRVPSFGEGEFFYVDQNHPSASDSNPGTEALPWLTIQKAASVLTAGQTVYVKNGTYINNSGTDTNPGDLNPANSGTAGAPIAFRAYPGHTPKVENNTTGPNDTPAVVLGSYGRDYIIWDGFEAVSNNPKLISFRSGADNCIFERMIVHGARGPNGNNTDGIRIEDVTDCTVRWCTIYDCRNASNTSNGTPIKIYTAEGTHVYQCTMYGCGSGIRNKTGGNNCLIELNWIYNITYFAFQTEGPSGDIIRNNIVANCGTPIVHRKSDGTDAVIENNTFYNCGQVVGGRAGCELRNSIIVGCTPPETDLDVCEYNLYYDGSVGCGSVVNDDPLFVVDPPSDPEDFKLDTGSPALGEGKSGENLGAYASAGQTEVIGEEP